MPPRPEPPSHEVKIIIRNEMLLRFGHHFASEPIMLTRAPFDFVSEVMKVFGKKSYISIYTYNICIIIYTHKYFAYCDK